MALSAAMEARLLALPWKSLQMGDCTFLCKVCFTDSAYCLLLSDLTSVWCEEVEAGVIQERSKELNKRLKAPISSFLSHLSRLLLPLLDAAGSAPNGFSWQRMEDSMMIHVKSQLSGLPFYWEFHCKEASVSTVCGHMVRPVISMAKALNAQRRELCALLLRKDAEIQDYQEGGAVLTRGRLQTEAFDEAAFQDSFLVESVPKLSSSWSAPGFSDPLQRLYNAVTAAEMKQNTEAEDVTRHTERPPGVAPSTGCEGISVTGEDPREAPPSAEPAAQPVTSQAPLADILSLTRSQTTVSKAKKRKAKGLFT